MAKRTVHHVITLHHGDAERGARSVWLSDDETAVDATPGTVGEFMSRDVVCVEPGVSIESVAAVFLQRNVGGLPVVDEGRRPIGFVSKSDIVRALSEGRLHEDLDSFDIDAPRRPARDVRDVMTPVCLAVRARDPVAEAAHRLTSEGIHHAPVVSDEGQVIGILTSFDLLRAVGPHPRHAAERRP